MKKLFLGLGMVILLLSVAQASAAVTIVEENLVIPDTQQIGVSSFYSVIDYGAYDVPLVPKGDSEVVIVPNAVLTLKGVYSESLNSAINWSSDAKLAGIRSIGTINLGGKSSMWQIAYGSFLKKKGYEIIIQGGSIISQKEVEWIGGGYYDYGYNVPVNWCDSGNIVGVLQGMPQYSNVTASSIIFYYNIDAMEWRYGLSTSVGVTSVRMPYGCLSGNSFYTQIQNVSGFLRIRSDHSLIGGTLKTVPSGWVVKVLKTTDDNGSDVGVDGYRWYQVYDATDGTTGWMVAKNLSDGTTYLDYNSGNQTELQGKAEIQLDTTEKRTSVILDAVNTYHIKDNSDNSLYGGGGGYDGLNNFQRFIQGSNFPKELILAISAEETGGFAFNNEQCSTAKDGGIGVMQITSSALKGLGSGLDNVLHKNDCDAKYGWAGSYSKYYSNTTQGIYANIKDGLRALQGKYRQKCPRDNIVIGGYAFTCQDIEKILTTWAYNGFIKDENGNYIWHYLKYVADKLASLNSYFSGISYYNNDNLIEKMRIADANKQIIKVYSPVELQVIDSNGKATGLVNGQVKEEIDNSLYESEQETVALFFPESNYTYRLIGKDNGEYGLLIDDERNGTATSFNARNIPIATNEVHQYEVNWSKMGSCGQGAVTLKIDYEGDGIFDRIVHSDCDLYEIEPPQITISSIENEYLLDSNIQINFSATDNLSGVASISATLNGAPVLSEQLVSLTKPGVNTFEVTAVDNEGNEATVTRIFSVTYSLSGFLSPVKPDGTGTYNQGRILPVKFQLTDVSSSFISSASAQLYVTKISDGIIGTDEVPLSSSSADTGNQFRYDFVNDQYIYNLSTGILNGGSWQLKAILDSGQIITAEISVK